MDTNLKTSKKIRAFLYRIISVASCFTMLATGLLGREAFGNLQREGYGTLTGSIYYLTEFREYISTLYTYAMLGYAGIGDELGEPLNDQNTSTLRNDYIREFKNELRFVKKDLACYIQVEDTVREHYNLDTSVYSADAESLLLPENVTLCCHWNGSWQELQFFSDIHDSGYGPVADYFSLQYQPDKNNISGVKLILGFVNNREFTSSFFQKFAAQAETYQRTLWTFLISLGLTLLFGLLSILSSKAFKAATTAYSKLSHGIYPELKLLLLVFLWVMCYESHLWHFSGVLQFRIFATEYLWMYPLFGGYLYLLYQDIKENGRGFWDASLLRALYRYMRDYQNSMAWYRKLSNIYICVRIANLLLFLAAAALFFLYTYSGPLFHVLAGLLLIAGILLLLYSIRLKRFLKDTKAMTEKISALRCGHENTPLTVSPQSLLSQATMDLNALEQGIEAAVEENVRANRMRVELITNVSHDLKTPLTSIINYADLLCEEQLPAPASEYATALRGKAYRLKGMVQDVFELSKATSGNLPVQKSRLDLAKLVRQTLADMDEQIQNSNLIFKLHIISEPLLIEADGERLYRVFQNLIVNALQYSLDHSRVYVQLDQEAGYAYAKIKNTSRDELDFKPEDIVERFVRRDTSRTTEGSGLGLSIAQSFTEACGGTFSLELDADLFTVTLVFPMVASDSAEDAHHI